MSKSIDREIGEIVGQIEGLTRLVQQYDANIKELLFKYATKLELQEVANELQKYTDTTMKNHEKEYTPMLDNLNRRVNEFEDILRPVADDLKNRKKDRNQLFWIVVSTAIASVSSLIVSLFT